MAMASRVRGRTRCTRARSGASWPLAAASSEKLKSTILAWPAGLTITLAARSDRWAIPAQCSLPTFDRYPRHGAPRPHSARPSLSLTYFTSVARGMKSTALCTPIASSGDAPGAKSNR
jgi:hypothetical protein